MNRCKLGSRLTSCATPIGATDRNIRARCHALLCGTETNVRTHATPRSSRATKLRSAFAIRLLPASGRFEPWAHTRSKIMCAQTSCMCAMQNIDMLVLMTPQKGSQLNTA
jgi:hypothetical protein